MPLDLNTLAAELENLDGSSEQTVIDTLSSAWTNYFYQSSILGVVATPGSLEAAKSAMAGGLVGISIIGNGSLAIQNGITAFWGAVAASAVSIWLVAPSVISVANPPTTLSAVASTLQPAFLSNTSASLSKQDSLKNIATILHTTAGLGGVAMVITPPATAAVPVPIL